MSEKVATVILHINPILLRDAKMCALELEIEPERFMAEAIEAEIAVRRLRKQIPTRKSIAEAKKDKVH
jgi:hypothetical protein